MKFNPDLWPASWILELIAKDDLHSFYNSTFWKELRKKILKEQKHRCWDCMHKSPAKITYGPNVHHINPVRERPDLALSEFDEFGKLNLVCLCDSCHWDRHHKRRPALTPERW